MHIENDKKGVWIQVLTGDPGSDRFCAPFSFVKPVD